MSANAENDGNKIEGGGASGDQESEKKSSPIEELLIIFLAQRNVKILAGIVADKNIELGDDVLKIVVERVRKGTDDEDQKKLLQQVVGNIGGDEEKSGDVRDNLVKVLKMQDKKLGVEPHPSKGRIKAYRQEAEQLAGKVNENKDSGETVELWKEVNGELGEVVKKMDTEEVKKTRRTIDVVRGKMLKSVEERIDEPMTEERKATIRKEVDKLGRRILDRKKPVLRMGMRERIQASVESKGLEIVGQFYQSIDEGGEATSKLFEEFDDDCYMRLIVFIEQLENRADDENFTEIYELSRRIEESWIKNKAMKAQEKMSGQQNFQTRERVNANVKTPDFENDGEMIDWIKNNDIGISVAELDILKNDPEKLKLFLENLQGTAQLRDVYRGGGQERMRNINYEHLDTFNKEIVARWKEDGLDVDVLGLPIPDVDQIKAGKKPPRVNTNLEGRAKEIMEEVLLQELLKQNRILVSESVERASMYYDERAQKYMTLLAIGGIDTTIKDTATNHMMLLQLTFAWRNGYVDEELYMKVMNFWSRQGPEYRLFEEVKRNEVIVIRDSEGKEVKELGIEVNQYDFEGVMAQNVPQELRDELGMYTYKKYKKGKNKGKEIIGSDGEKIKVYVDRSWGTVLARKTEGEGMKKDRKIFVKQMLITKYGVDGFAKMTDKVEEGELLDQMVNNYGDYISRTYLYWIGTGRLGEVVGNGSFDNAKFDLPQGIPEYYMKRDPRLLVRFMWKYTPIRVPEALLGLDRMGLPSFHSMNGGETTAHFTSSKDTTEGAKGGRSTFFVEKDGVTEEELVEANEWWNNVWNKALYNDDEYHFGGKNNPFYKAVAYQEKQTRPRRNNSETIRILLEEAGEKGDDFFERISWDWAIKKYSYDRELVKKLKSEEITGKAKFEYFSKRFNDGYFVTDALKAKRGDDALKYRASYQQKFYEALIEYGSNPEPENLAALAGVVASIVGPNIKEFRQKTAKIVFEILKQRQPGEVMSVIDYEGGSVMFDEEVYSGVNKGEMPMPRFKKIVHNPWDKDIVTDSIATYRALEGKAYEPELLWKVLMRNMRAANLYRDEDEYRKERKEQRKEQRKEFFGGWKWDSDIGAQWNMLYNTKNAWDIVTLKRMTEYLATEVFDLPPHLFWEWVVENSEKTFGVAAKYFTS